MCVEMYKKVVLGLLSACVCVEMSRNILEGCEELAQHLCVEIPSVTGS